MQVSNIEIGWEKAKRINRIGKSILHQSDTVDCERKMNTSSPVNANGV